MWLSDKPDRLYRSVEVRVGPTVERCRCAALIE
jgi:hypothetical protein